MAYNTINSESSSLCSIASDIDKYRNRYQTYETQLDGTNINITFVAPRLDILENNRFYILQNCVYKRLPHKYKYRPDYLSYAEYGTTNWWALLMWINDCRALEYFNMENVLVPTSTCLSELSLETQKTVETKSFNDDEFQYSIHSILYRLPNNNLPASNTLLSDTVSQLTSTTTNTDNVVDESSFVKEQFTMTIPTLRLRYVDLSYEPDLQSLQLVAKCKPNLVYGKHYTIIGDDNNDSIRLTWDPSYVTGSGLIFRLKENDIIQVTYVKKQ